MTDSRPLRFSTGLACLAGVAVLAIGCTSPTNRSDSKLADFFKTPEWRMKAPWSKKEPSAPEPYPGPVKLAVTWTPDVLVQTGRKPTRGFGGRLFFFDEKSKAVPVEGTLTVHGFEGDTSSESTQVRPFKFTPEQFTRHFSQSDFGASYSIWIPWDAAGGPQKRVSLVATFQTTSGKFVQASPTTIILPGAQANDQSQIAGRPVSQQYQGHVDAVAQHATRPSGLVTTTIRRHSGTNLGPRHESVESISKRLDRIASTHRTRQVDGDTPFVDVPLTPAKPTVMAASAEMPTVSAPRRIRMPVADDAQ
ncbi:hypothetical protein FYK55_06450 [Roseiconus nitratireducens]|uniref:Uncharacterized protein n=1 Tax=Roseiconus nitratireducens TaxID=2605748 RepID=A0A5M6DG73_9BACT|nr:hypothetical protein [Roseiconus nitratireducens]KAA5545292.1 hypothetical protein FYK55_06450 [Roseiconus nitratireducens]